MPGPRRRLVRFRAALADSDPEIWRLLEVDADLTLDQVHRVLQIAFGWTDSHLHQFLPVSALAPARRARQREPRWVMPLMLEEADDEDGELVDERTVTLGDVLTEDTSPLLYEYDFGDGWLHRLEYVETIDAEADAPRATVVRAAGAPAIDDIGGVHGWEEARQRLTRPATRDDQLELEHWQSLSGRPEPFADDVDVDGLRLALAALFAEHTPAHGALVAELLDAMLPSAVPEFTARLTEAGADEPPEVGEAMAASLLAPYRALLARAIATPGGVRLTKAGRIAPAVVQELAMETGPASRRTWAITREGSSPEMARLHDGAKRLGLVRKYRDSLRPLREAARLHDDPVGLWHYLAARAIRSTDPAERLAQILLLVELAAGRSVRDAEPALAHGLRLCGWTDRQGLPVAGSTVRDLIAPLVHQLGPLGAFERGRPSPGLRAFARTVLAGSGRP